MLHWIRTAAAGRAALIPVLVLWLLTVGSPVQAEDRLVRLAVPQALVFIIFVPDSRRSHDAPTGLFDRLRDLGFDVGPEEAVLVATVERVAKPGTRVTTFAG